MTQLPDDVRAAAVHGSWCPKLCSHACPVLGATGRDDAVPWSFHRVLTDLASGVLDAQHAAPQLHACTGCLACQVPCAFDQDVPGQVRAGRAAVAAAGAPLAASAPAVGEVAAGRSPYGVEPVDARPVADGAATVLAGCREDRDSAQAVVALFAAAGVEVALAVPDGCCGATLADLGDTAAAAAARDRLAATLGGATEVIALDPHCLPAVEEAVAVPARHAVVAVAELLADGRLAFEQAPRASVTYHDPCLLARGHAPVTNAPRELLDAAGYDAIEPEGSATTTACSGAGMAFELVDLEAAEAVAVRRRGQLRAAAPTVVTACAGARRRLAADGTTVHDLFTLLAARLPRSPS